MLFPTDLVVADDIVPVCIGLLWIMSRHGLPIEILERVHCIRVPITLLIGTTIVEFQLVPRLA